MVDGGLAICIMVTIGFAVFIVWARTSRGQMALRATLGERQPRQKPTASRLRPQSRSVTSTMAPKRATGAKCAPKSPRKSAPAPSSRTKGTGPDKGSNPSEKRPSKG